MTPLFYASVKQDKLIPNLSKFREEKRSSRCLGVSKHSLKIKRQIHWLYDFLLCVKRPSKIGIFSLFIFLLFYWTLYECRIAQRLHLTEFRIKQIRQIHSGEERYPVSSAMASKHIHCVLLGLWDGGGEITQERINWEKQKRCVQ